MNMIIALLIYNKYKQIMCSQNDAIFSPRTDDITYIIFCSISSYLIIEFKINSELKQNALVKIW